MSVPSHGLSILPSASQTLSGVKKKAWVQPAASSHLNGKSWEQSREDLVTVWGQPLWSQHFLWTFWSCKPVLNCLRYIVLGILLSIAQAFYLYQSCWLFLLGLQPQRIMLMEMSNKHIWLRGNKSCSAVEGHGHECNSLLTLLQSDSQYLTGWG